MSYAVQRVLHKTLSSYLDAYTVSPLSRENLSVSLRKGYLNLKDVELKAAADSDTPDWVYMLPPDPFPFRVRSGKISTLSIHFSWTLRGRLSVEITDAEIELEEFDESDCSNFDEKIWTKLEAQLKTAEADAADEPIKPTERGYSLLGWKNALIQRVLRLVQISVRDVRILVHTKDGLQYGVSLEKLIVDTASPETAAKSAPAKDLQLHLTATHEGQEIASLACEARMHIEEQKGALHVQLDALVTKFVLDCPSRSGVLGVIEILKRAELWKRRRKNRSVGRPQEAVKDAPAKWFRYAQRVALRTAQRSVLSAEGLRRHRETRSNYCSLLEKALSGKSLSDVEKWNLLSMEASLPPRDLAVFRMLVRRRVDWNKSHFKSLNESDERKLIIYNLLHHEEAERTDNMMTNLTFSVSVPGATIGFLDCVSLHLEGIQIAGGQENSVTGSVKRMSLAQFPDHLTAVSEAVLYFKVAPDTQLVRVTQFSLSLGKQQVQKLILENGILSDASNLPEDVTYEDVALALHRPSQVREPEKTLTIEGLDLSLDDEDWNAPALFIRVGYLYAAQSSDIASIRAFGVCADIRHTRIIHPLHLRLQWAPRGSGSFVDVHCQAIRVFVKLEDILYVHSIFVSPQPASTTKMPIVEAVEESKPPNPTNPHICLRLEDIDLEVATVARVHLSQLQLDSENSSNYKLTVSAAALEEKVSWRKKDPWDRKMVALSSSSREDGKVEHPAIVLSANGSRSKMQVGTVILNICTPVILEQIGTIKKFSKDLSRSQGPPATRDGTSVDEKPASQATTENASENTLNWSVELGSTSISLGDWKEPLLTVSMPSMQLKFADSAQNRGGRLEIRLGVLHGRDNNLGISVASTDGETIVEYLYPRDEKRFYCYVTLVERTRIEFTRAVNDALNLFTLILDAALEPESALNESQESTDVPDALTLHVTAPFVAAACNEYDSKMNAVVALVRQAEYSMVENYKWSENKTTKTVTMRIRGNAEARIRSDTEREFMFLEETRVDMTIDIKETDSLVQNVMRLAVPSMSIHTSVESTVVLNSVLRECVMTIPPTKDTVEIVTKQERLFVGDMQLSFDKVLMDCADRVQPDAKLMQLRLEQLKLSQREKKKTSTVDFTVKHRVEVGLVCLTDERDVVFTKPLSLVILAKEVAVDAILTSRSTNILWEHATCQLYVPVDLVMTFSSGLREADQRLAASSARRDEEFEGLNFAEHLMYAILDDDANPNLPPRAAFSVSMRNPLRVTISESSNAADRATLSAALPSASFTDDGFCLSAIEIYLCPARDIAMLGDYVGSVTREAMIVLEDARLSGISARVDAHVENIVVRASVGELLLLAEVAEELSNFQKKIVPLGELEEEQDREGRSIVEIDQGQRREAVAEPVAQMNQTQSTKQSNAPPIEADLLLKRAEFVLINSRVSEEVVAMRAIISLGGSLNTTGGHALLSLAADFKPPSSNWKSFIDKTSISLSTGDMETVSLRANDDIAIAISSRIFLVLEAAAAEVVRGRSRADFLDSFAVGSVNPRQVFFNASGRAVALKTIVGSSMEAVVPDGRRYQLANDVHNFLVQLEGLSSPLTISTRQLQPSIRTLPGAEDAEFTQIRVGAVVRGSSKLFTLSSPWKLVNETSEPLWYRTSSRAEVNHLMNPGESCLLPVSTTVRDLLTFSMDGINWSVRTHEIGSATPDEDAFIGVRGPLSIRVATKEEATQQLILLRPALVIENGIPTELQVQQDEPNSDTHRIPTNESRNVFTASLCVRFRPWGHFWSEKLCVKGMKETSGVLRLFKVDLQYVVSWKQGVPHVRVRSPLCIYNDLPNVLARISNTYPASGKSSLSHVISKQSDAPKLFSTSDGFWVQIGRSRWSRRLHLPRSEEGLKFEYLNLEEAPKIRAEPVISGSALHNALKLASPTKRWYRVVVCYQRLGRFGKGSRQIVLKARLEFANMLDRHDVFVGEARSVLAPVKVLSGERQSLFYFKNENKINLTFRFDQSGWEWSAAIRVPENLGPSDLREEVLRFRNTATGAVALPRISFQRTDLGVTRVVLLDEVQLTVPFMLYNPTRHYFRIYQSEVFNAAVVLGPGSFESYAWDEPTKEKVVEIEIKNGESPEADDTGFVAAGRVSPEKAGKFHFGGDQDVPPFSVKVEQSGDTNIITFDDSASLATTSIIPFDHSNTAMESVRRAGRQLRLNVRIPNIEIAVTDDSYAEVVAATMRHINVAYETKVGASQVEAWVGDIEYVRCKPPRTVLLGRWEGQARRTLKIPKDMLHMAASWMKFGPTNGALHMIRFGAELQPLHITFDTEITLLVLHNLFMWWDRLSQNLEEAPKLDSEEDMLRWRSIYIANMDLKPFSWRIEISSNENARKEMDKVAMDDAVPIEPVVVTCAKAIMGVLHSASARVQFDEVNLARICDSPEGILERVGSTYRANALKPTDLSVNVDFLKPVQNFFESCFSLIRSLFRGEEIKPLEPDLTDLALDSLKQARNAIGSQSTAVGVLHALTKTESRKHIYIGNNMFNS